MPTIITKYSDYAIQSIEFFLKKIEDDLIYRDIKGLTNGKIEKIVVTKQHPLVALRMAELSGTDIIRSSLIPAIAVTPGSSSEEAFTLGKGFRPEIIDADFVAILEDLQDKTTKEIQTEVLITQDQISAILDVYDPENIGSLRVQENEWYRNEEVNVSVWSDSPDLDILFGNIMDSILSDIQTGFAGDMSRIKNLHIKITKGLTNFNYGRVLFGTEYGLTFLNTFVNYTVYSDDVISGHDFIPTTNIPGSDNG